MKIKHNIKRYWKVLEWKILDTIFEEGEERGDIKYHYSKDGEFYICSNGSPELSRWVGMYVLYVFWESKYLDHKGVSYTYSTEEEAQKILDYINEFTVPTVEEEK